MVDNPLARKLLIKPGHRVAILNAPANFLDRLSPLPEGVDLIDQPESARDVVLLFVTDTTELDRLAHLALGAVKRNGALWVSYPKKTSKLKTDLSRDMAWRPLREAGFEVVSAIAIDEVWSALRFRPLELVGT